ncbi:hypothetical protein GN958_ATG18749 [Phytophthora infestans]|uniref:Uncharacterized protein n=1 Tax=Phytophthora infestans TaxID=4787 RepID=A0A8S9TZ07_PHYIN|nr:hypothetical protein GN958_ATG18749 [Phytophthora infestans]
MRFVFQVHNSYSDTTTKNTHFHILNLVAEHFVCAPIATFSAHEAKQSVLRQDARLQPNEAFIDVHGHDALCVLAVTSLTQRDWRPVRCVHICLYPKWHEALPCFGHSASYASTICSNSVPSKAIIHSEIRSLSVALTVKSTPASASVAAP